MVYLAVELGSHEDSAYQKYHAYCQVQESSDGKSALLIISKDLEKRVQQTIEDIAYYGDTLIGQY